VSALFRRTGSMAKPAQRRHGRESRVDRALLEKLVRRKPDIVLRELQAELAIEGVRVSIALIAVVLKQMGLRLKKSRSTPPSATQQPTANAANSSSGRSPRSRRKT